MTLEEWQLLVESALAKQALPSDGEMLVYVRRVGERGMAVAVEFLDLGTPPKWATMIAARGGGNYDWHADKHGVLQQSFADLLAAAREAKTES